MSDKEVLGTCDKRFARSGESLDRAHFYGAAHYEISGVCENWRPVSPEAAPTPRKMLTRNEYQSCPNCDTRWYANEILPCPRCSRVVPGEAAPKEPTLADLDRCPRCKSADIGPTGRSSGYKLSCHQCGYNFMEPEKLSDAEKISVEGAEGRETREHTPDEFRTVKEFAARYFSSAMVISVAGPMLTFAKKFAESECSSLIREREQLHEAVRFLLEWMPVCSVGSSGHSRRVAVEKLLGEAKIAR